MNVGPTPSALASAAGAPLAQSAGTETERTSRESSARQRTVDGQNRSAAADGIGEMSADQQAGERDADGRRLWEDNRQHDAAEAAAEPTAPRQARDPSGVAGNALDLTG